MRQLLFKFAGLMALRSGRLAGLWRKLGPVRGADWAEYLRRHGGLHRMGQGCSVQTNVSITDPAYTVLGNNVHLSGCTLFGHDGSVNMLAKLLKRPLDKVGPVILGDFVFIGHQAIVMPGVRIGSRCIVAAGAVVVSDVPDGTVVGGVPAKPIGSTAALCERLLSEVPQLPWYDLITSRKDPAAGADPALDALRKSHFFSDLPAA